MTDLIVHLDREQTRKQRTKLLANDAYVLFCDHLRQLHRDEETALSQVELFLSAERFAELLLSLPNIQKGIDDELDDLEEDAEGENDAMIISVLAACLISAQRVSRPAFDWQFAVLHILIRWDKHPLLDPMLEAAAGEEKARRMEGKKTDLLTCELNESLENDDLDGARALMSDIVDYNMGLTPEAIQYNLLTLMAINDKNDRAFDEQINRLQEILNKKTTTQATTQVNVQPGGTNMQYVENYNK